MPSVRINRRGFLECAAGAGLAGWIASRGMATADASSEERLKKAVKIGMVQGDMPLADKFALVKEVGFDGIELDSPNNLELEQVLEARDKSGLTIHGVVDSVHWRDSHQLSHPDPEVRKRGMEALITAMKDSKAYGGTTVLLVPAVVNKQVSYDEAYARSQASIREAIPYAEDLGITIALENVWNQFLLSPMEAARYIDELGSPRVGAYFDVGNVVTYGWPEQWIRILNQRIVKLDIKEFSRKMRDEKGLWQGFAPDIGDGDCDWPAVMQALRDIGFKGWATAEVPGGGKERLAEIARRMDKAFAT